VESTLTIKEESTLIRDRHHKVGMAEVDIAAEEVDIVAEEVDVVEVDAEVVDVEVVVVVVVMDNFTLGYVGDSLGNCTLGRPWRFCIA